MNGVAVRDAPCAAGARGPEVRLTDAAWIAGGRACYDRLVRSTRAAAAVILAAIAWSCGGGGQGDGDGDGPGDPDGAAPPGDASAPDATVELPRHQAGPYKAYLGTLHDHHYGKNAGDDGGLKVDAPDEPGQTGSAEWWAFRKQNPGHYAGGSAQDAYAAAAAAGLDFFALTPHNHLIDNEEYGAVLAAAAAAPGVIALYGQEWSSVGSGNHVHVMNVVQRVTVPNGQYAALLDSWLPGYIAGHPLAQTTFAARPYVVLCHPALTTWDYGAAEKAALEYGLDDYPTRAAWAQALGAHARLVELMSGDEGDEQNLSRVLDLLNDGLRIGFSVGPDNHRQRWGTRNDRRMGALATAWTAEALNEALHLRRTYAAEDRDLGAHLAVLDGPGGAPIAWLGGEVSAPGGMLVLEVGFEDPTHPGDTYQLEVLVDAAPGGAKAAAVAVPGLPGSVGQGRTELTIAAPPPGGYVVVHATSSRGGDVWFSPVWVK